MAKKNKKINISIGLNFSKLKIFSLLIAVVALPLLVFMVTNTNQKYEIRSQAALKNDIDSLDVKIERNKKEKKEKENTALLYKRKELMKELGYKYPEEFLKKAKSKVEKDKFSKEQQDLIEEKVKKNGSLGRVILDDFENEVSETDYTLGSDNEVYQISFVKEPNEEELGDDNKVDLSGYQLEELIVTDDYDISSYSQVLGSSSIGTKKFIVVPITFRDDRTKPITKYKLAKDIFCDPSCTESVKTYYRKLSGGQLTISGKVLDYWDTPYYKNDMCNHSYLFAEKLKKDKPGLFDGRYYGIIFINPKPNCNSKGTIGKSNYGPAISWVTTNNNRVVIHELGHNFGIHHASMTRCDGSFNCLTDLEYGDASDVMGSRLANLNGPHLLALEFKPHTIMKTVSSTGTYKVYKMNGGANPKIIKVDISDRSTDLYIEYRGGKYNYDVDTSLFLGKGVLVYAWNGKKGSRTYVIKTIYENDPIFRDGQVWKYSNFYKIKQLNHTSDYASLRITKL